MTQSIHFTWKYGKARFKVFAEVYNYKGDLEAICEAECLNNAALFVKLTNPNFSQELHDEVISQYHAHLTDAAIDKIDQP